MAKPKCPCPIYCLYCGAKRRRDNVGHYCPTPKCQWHHGFKTCTLHKTPTPTPSPSEGGPS